MPLYEYKCKFCGESTEIRHGFEESRPKKCTKCGKMGLEKTFNPTDFFFKGNGSSASDNVVNPNYNE